MGYVIDTTTDTTDLVILDTRPGTHSDTEDFCLLSDLVLIPVQLSPMDVWATRPTIDMATRERVPVLVVAALTRSLIGAVVVGVAMMALLRAAGA